MSPGFAFTGGFKKALGRLLGLLGDDLFMFFGLLEQIQVCVPLEQQVAFVVFVGLSLRCFEWPFWLELR